MAKISKYEKMVGSVVDGVLVSDYRKTQKQSLKTGRSYYKYEVELENIVWVSTTAFNRKTYGRKLDKARQFSTKPKNSKPKETKVKEEPRYEVALIPSKPITADLLERDIERLQNTLHYKEFKKVFRELAGKYHPDKCGNSTVFGLIKEIYDFQGSVLKDVEDAVKFIIEEENGNEEDYKEMMKCSIYLHTTMYDLRASIHGEQRGISKYYQKWSHIEMEDILRKCEERKAKEKPSQDKVKEPVKEEPKPSQDKPKDKVKEPVKKEPKETKVKTKTKQEQKLEEEYDYYFNYYKNLLDDNFKYIIKEYVKDCEYTDKKVSVKTAIKKVYKIYREPETDFTAKSKFTNERRRNKNKAYNDAWKSLEIENRVQDMIKEVKDELERLRREEKERIDEINRKVDFEHMVEKAYEGKEDARKSFERAVERLKNFDNITISGNSIFESAEDYFNSWNNFYVKQMEESVEEFKEDSSLVTIFISCLNEWLTEWQEKFHQAVINEWPAVEERRKQKQREQFERIHGKDFEERWQRKNFGSSKAKEGFNKFDNEFDKLKDAREIKKLYRKLSKVNHPDLGGNETDFIQLKDAYDRAMARVA